MVNYLKSKWMYYAIAVLVATVAAYESVWLFLWLGVLLLFCVYKRLARGHLIALTIVSAVTFSYVSWQLDKLYEPFSVPAELIWTSEYKINGSTLRGFMKDTAGRNIYIIYTFSSEQEKAYFGGMQLAGQHYFVTGNIEAPDLPAHEYGFNMQNYLKSKNALGILEISSWHYIEKDTTIMQKLAEQRFRLKQHIEHTFPESLVAEAQALLIGLQENVEYETSRAYQKLGITHLFAISGLHVALVSFMFFQGLLRLGVRRELATVILIAILPIYGVVAGGAPSVWRAVSVVEFVMLAGYFRWRVSLIDALAISFIGFVILQPGAVFQIGFQLSYLATLSLIFSSRLLASMPNWWAQSFMITFVCQLLVYPLLLVHFYELSLSSFLANIVFVPLFSLVILPFNFLLLVATYLPIPIDTWLFSLYEPCRTMLTKLIMFLQSLPYQMWIPGKPGVAVMIVCYISVLVTLYYAEVRKWRLMLPVLLIPAIVVQLIPYTNKNLIVSFINVGQGDSILIELPYRKAVYLIDTGGLLRFEQEAWKERNDLYEVGRQIVVPYLKGKGIAKIDTLILTHADADHVEGAEEILREIAIREVHVTPNSLEKAVMNDFLEEVAKKKIVIREQLAGHNWEIGNTVFRYIWPTETDYEGNNDSLVLVMEAGPFKALFTGDLEKEGEAALVSSAYQDIKNVTLLKAGHHGSKTSSTEDFINAANPQLTIFMAGKNNRYKHPHNEVVERFNMHGFKHLTTGEVGTVIVIWDGENTHYKTSNRYFEQ
ncbi:DNA internalization-related competence protein ComEC/Rec2 [Solibacillus sp. CAU 1738]|uniref:DNA internalization-related competence protein ComEC/Rec2 n=1 Tax=Solibacillus sp. CAU 1738 TaxID=3140363 RepID=UPI003260C07E